MKNFFLVNGVFFTLLLPLCVNAKDICVKVDESGSSMPYHFKWHVEGSLKKRGAIVPLHGIRIDSSLGGAPWPMTATAVVRSDGKVDINYCGDCIVQGLDSQLAGVSSGDVYSAIDCKDFPLY